MKIFELGFVLKAITEAFTAKMQGVIEMTEKVNAAARQTAGLREMAGTLGKIGAVSVGAGAAIAYPLYRAVQGYEDVQEHIDNIGASLGGLSDKTRESIDLFAKQQAVITGFDASSYIDTVYQGTSAFLSLKQAEAVAGVAGKVARSTKGDPVQVAQVLTTAMLNFSDKSKSATQNAQILGDKLTAIQTSGKWPNITNLNYALSEGAGPAKAFGLSFDQLLGAMSAWSAAGEDSTKAGMALRETLSQLSRGADKLGISIKRTASGGFDLYGTVQEIHDKFQGLNRVDLGKILTKAFGERGSSAIVELMDHTKEFKASIDTSANAAGATDRAFSNFQKHGLLAFQQLHQAIANISDSVGGALAPQIESLVKYLGKFANLIEKLTETHPGWVRFAATTAEIAAGVLLLGGGLALASSALLGFASFIPAVIKFAQVTKIATAVQWAFDAAFTPLGLGVIAIAALAVGLYEAYEHWTAFRQVVDKTVTWFKTYNWRNLGLDLITGIGEGILSGLHLLEAPLTKIGSFILDHFKGHSPPPLGPLHQLNQVRIVETIAQTLHQTAPLTTALDHLAGIVMGRIPMPMPMMVTAGVPGVGVPLPKAVLAAPGGGMRVAAAGAGGIVVNVTYNVKADSPADFEQSAHRHADTLVRIVEDKLARRQRLAFK